VAHTGPELSDVERTFYRIFRAEKATLEDFKSAKALGKPLRDPSQLRAWEEGVSAFDSLDYARARARVFKFALGRWIMPLRVPSDGSIKVTQSGHDRLHFTIYAIPEQLLSFAESDAVAVED
jgi:hypothetical protein